MEITNEEFFAYQKHCKEQREWNEKYNTTRGFGPFNPGILHELLEVITKDTSSHNSLGQFRLKEYYSQRPDLKWIKSFVDELYSKQVRHIKNIYTIGNKYNVVISISPPPKPFFPIGYRINKYESEVNKNSHKPKKESNEIESITQIEIENQNKIYDYDKQQYHIIFSADDAINILDRKKGKEPLFLDLCYTFSPDKIRQQQKEKLQDIAVSFPISKLQKVTENAKEIAYELERKIPHEGITELIIKIVNSEYDKNKISEKNCNLLKAYHYYTNSNVWDYFLNKIQENCNLDQKRQKYGNY